jgi:hypothetical protein
MNIRKWSWTALALFTILFASSCLSVDVDSKGWRDEGKAWRKAVTEDNDDSSDRHRR